MKATESRIHRMELGRYRTWIMRLGGYLAPVNFTLILYGFVTDDPFGVSWNVWLVGTLIAVPCLMVFDVLVIYPSELRYAYDKNKRMKRLEEKIDLILFRRG